MTQEKNTPSARPAAWSLAGLVVLALLLYWVGNDRTPLWDRDEPRFAEATRRMLETRDFVVPEFHGQLRPDKPVLGYWFMAAGMSLFGAGEFGVRFFSGIFAALSVVVLWRLARSMTGSDRLAFWAAAMLATAPVMFVQGKLCTVDAGLLFWLLLSFSGLWKIWQGPCGAGARVLFWAPLALAMITKGPVALAAVFMPVVILGIFAADRSFLKRMGWIWGVPLFLAICLPWAWSVQVRTGGEFLRLSLGRHVVERTRAPLEGHSGFPGFYVATLFGTFFPWAFFVPGAIWSVFGGLREKKLELFLVAWAVGLVIILEFVRTKMVHYSLPVFPALAILVALFIEDNLRGRLVAAGAWSAFVMAVVLAVAAPVAVGVVGMEAAVFPMAGAGVILVGGMLAAALGAKSGLWRGRALGAVAGWLFVIAAWGLPMVGSYGSTPAVMAAIVRARAHLQADAGVATLGYSEPSLVFYLGGDVDVIAGADDFQADPVVDTPRIVVVEQRRSEVVEELEGRVMVEWDRFRGFNFAPGRWQDFTLYLDYGG